MTETDERVYFTVLDPAGKAFPAVAYWAGVMDEDDPGEQAVQLRRFVKLIGPDEPLAEVTDGVFEGTYSKQKFTRFPTELESYSSY